MAAEEVADKPSARRTPRQDRDVRIAAANCGSEYRRMAQHYLVALP